MKRISLLMLAASLAAGAQASEPPSAETAEPANTVIAASNEAAASVYESAQKVKFSWGADIGAAIDLSANDMSAVDVSAMFGLKWRWLKFAGVGAQAKLMTMNSCRSFPVFLKLRTNFRDGDSLLFWDVSAGVSLNYLEDDHRQNGLYA
ncbi:MAG: hypothetical protein K2F63_00720, partial [Muribaculaceae bacterium]|nr:hypothetical protein [Muribaculaceae bacterium]